MNQSPDVDRAEQAFRDAFTDHAAEADLTPLTAPRGRRARPAWRWVAAACAVLVAVGVPVGLFLGGDDGRGPVTATPAQTPSSGLPDPEPGWKWVSKYDVAVQVPEGWEPTVTTVDLHCNPGMRVPWMPVDGWGPTDTPCPGDAERGARMTPAVAFIRTPSEDPPPEHHREFTNTTVAVLLPEAPTDDQSAEAERILGTARVFDRNEDGCRAVSPGDADPVPGDVTSGVVSACTYETSGSPLLLERSWAYGAEESAAILAAFAGAPVGVTAASGSCPATGSPLTLPVSAGGELRLHFDRCGESSVDDGVTVRQFTLELCEAVFGPDAPGQAGFVDAPDCSGLPSADPVVPEPTRSPETPSTATLSGLPEPRDGWKWVSFERAAVQVPSDWEYSEYPATYEANPCVAGEEPEYPYIGVTYPVAVFSIGCDPVPERIRNQPHLLFGAVDDAEAGASRDIAGTRVTVVLPLEATSQMWETAEAIVDSAVTFERDHSGCSPTTPVDGDDARPTPWDVTTADGVLEVGLCQYSEHQLTEPSVLQGSRLLTGDEARALVAGIAAAPEGVLNRPENCSSDWIDPGTVLRILDTTGTHEVFLRTGGCVNVGFDDGVTHRLVTEAACAPVFAREPLSLSSWQFTEVGVCHTAH